MRQSNQTTKKFQKVSKQEFLGEMAIRDKQSELGIKGTSTTDHLYLTTDVLALNTISGTPNMQALRIDNKQDINKLLDKYHMPKKEHATNSFLSGLKTTTTPMQAGKLKLNTIHYRGE